MKQPNDHPSFEFLVFTDLHVSADTLERSCTVLRMLGQAAAQKGCPIVCLGDFWDARGVLATRQVDAVLREIEEWQRLGVAAIMIPGNHDQVSMQGEIHAMRIFEAFDNIIVATEPIMDPVTRVAFLPWREDPQDQAQIFNLDPPGNWTIFAHAELRGATTNHGHKAPGRITLAQINTVARACYLGHYHDRQKIGDRTWYLGNPFELHMGERGQPKGVAFVTSDSVDPEFINLEDFPKHHRVDLRTDREMGEIRAGDILEIVGTRAQFRDPAIEKWMASLPVEDLRQHFVREEVPEAPPPMGESLDDAIDTYVGEHEDAEELAELGRALLDEAHDPDEMEPIGTKTRILYVHGEDFCGLQGGFKLPLEDQGAVMLRGPQGVGKTALVDAVSWCLYGRTAPRKPGNDAPSLRGDEVINDNADACAVTVGIEVDGERYEVIRKKKRGKGDRVRVKGPHSRPDGILGDAEWVEALVGMSYALWRSCVSLGQGAVANWLTSTDKHRKALLSDAHGLSVCERARKIVRKRLKAYEDELADAKTKAATLEGAIQQLEEMSFSDEAQEWEGHRAQRMDELEEAIDDAEDKAIKAERALDDAPDVEAENDELEDQILKLQRRLSVSKGGTKKDALQKSIGAAEAERSMVERDRNLLSTKLQSLIASAQGKAHGVCPTCEQPWDHASIDHHASEIEQQIKSKEFEINTLNSRIANAEMELAGLTGNEGTEREKILEKLKKLQGEQGKLREVQNAIAKLRSNAEAARAEKQRLAEERRQLAEAENPYAARAESHKKQLEAKRGDYANLNEEIEETHAHVERLRFWFEGFGQNGLPVVVMRSAMGDLEDTANEFLGRLTQGKLWATLSLEDDALDVSFLERDGDGWRMRRYEQLSGGQRRCAELAFSPLGLSEMLFRRLKCKVPLLVIDELTTHLGAREKVIACQILHDLDRETVLVIDHDPTVQGQFDVVYEVTEDPTTRATKLRRL